MISKTFAERPNQFLLAYRVIALLLLASFGPYVLPSYGVRLDQVMVYAIFVPLLIVWIASSRHGIAFLPTVCVVAIAFVTLWTCLVSLFLPSAAPWLKQVAMLESYLQPAVVLLTVAIVTGRLSQAAKAELLVRASFIFALCLAGNALLAIADAIWGLEGFLSAFVDTHAADSVWAKSRSMGRYNGIFMQPFEAGVAYSIGLLAMSYRIARLGGSVRDLVLCLLTCFGGVLSVSKVFLIGGVPLSFLYLAIARGNFRGFVALAAFVMMLMAFFLSTFQFFSGHWDGHDYLGRLFDLQGMSVDDALRVYSAGRFGDSDTVVNKLFYEVLTQSPIYGFGFAAHSPLDNAYLQFLYQGGIIALAVYVSLLGVIFFGGISTYHSSRKEALFILVMLLFIFLSGIGASTTTVNRASVALWLLLGLVLQRPYRTGSVMPGSARDRLLGRGA